MKPLQHTTLSTAVFADEVVDLGEVVEDEWVVANPLKIPNFDSFEHFFGLLQKRENDKVWFDSWSNLVKNRRERVKFHPKMSTIRLTLNQSFEEIIQELEEAYKPMSRTEILKMAVAEFYRQRMSQANKKTKNTQLVDDWLDTGQEPDLPKGQAEEAFGDWWSQNKTDLRN